MTSVPELKKMKEHIEEAVKMTALEKFRKAAAEREKKHAEIEKNQSKDGRRQMDLSTGISIGMETFQFILSKASLLPAT